MTMQVKIKHNTHYNYMDTIFLEPHTLRLFLRPDNHIKVIRHKVTVAPRPEGRANIELPEGAHALFVWFQGMTKELDIIMDAVVETTPFNPFDFLIYPASCLRLPLVYPNDWKNIVEPYRAEQQPGYEIKKFATDIAQQSNFETTTFLVNLCTAIYETFTYEKREHGKPHNPEETLKLKRGSCRDFAVLAMAACRAMGIASRYVSGYYISESSDEPSDLHAWLEVYLPGAGWRGFDPSHGIACGHLHLALCASRDPLMTLPVTGAYRGFASSFMTTKLSIDLTQPEIVSKN